MVRLRALVLAIPLAGCSLLIDNSGFIGSPDAGDADAATTDGGLDAGPDAPSSPVVHIEPASPAPGDALEAIIDTESVDPLDRGAVTYEHRWLRDGSDAGVTTATVPAGTIANGETWRVQVTPVTSDGRRGVPGEATVTVGNSPPTIGTVGLSTYRPIVGDPIEALPGATLDPDGDPVRIVYEWYLDDARLAGASSSRLMVDPSWTPGSRLRVEARAVDTSDAESAIVRSGDGIVLAGGTRWVELLPDRNAVVAGVRDSRHERIVLLVYRPMVGETRLWEHDLGNDRFVQLRPEGAPASGSDFQNDVVVGNGRVFVVDDPGGGVVLQMLDLSSRGAERWSMIDLDPSVRVTGRSVGGIYDEVRDTLYVALEEGGSFDVVAFALGTSPVVPTVVVSDTSAPIERAGWVLSPEREEILLAGGLGSDLVHRLDVSAGAATELEELPTRLPRAIAGAAIGWDPVSSRYVLGFGLEGLDTLVDQIWWFDPGTGAFTAIETADGPGASFFGWIGPVVGDELVFWTGSDNPFLLGEHQLMVVDRGTDRLAPMHVFGVHLPPPLRRPFNGSTEQSFFFFGGRDEDDLPAGQAWRLPFPARVAGARLQRVSATADPVEGEPPPSWGQASADLGALYVFGGEDTSGSLAGPVFRLSSTAWEALTMRGDTAPDARTGGVMFPGCGDLTLFGGTTAAGPTDEVWQLDCVGGSCSWSEITTMGTGPSPRTGAAVGVFGRVLYGGFPGGTEAYEYDGCAHSWTPLSVRGSIGPRFAHGMTATYLFGGSDGSTYRNDTYELTLGSGELVATELAILGDGDGLPPPRSEMAIGSDPDSGRLYVYGGYAGDALFTGPRVFADLWELRP